jgi:hypothetical protein
MLDQAIVEKFMASLRGELSVMERLTNEGKHQTSI